MSTSLSVTAQPKPATHVPVMDHALKARAIQRDRALRLAHNTTATAEILYAGLTKEALKDLADLQQSAWQRLSSLQKSWLSDWLGWFNYADKINGANTLSKLVEMESNILARAASLLGTQLTSLVALQENVEVDYAFLVTQILNRDYPARKVSK